MGWYLAQEIVSPLLLQDESRQLPFRFDLQLFAAEDEGRTEEPTEYKKRKAREEGKVAKTQELPSALILLFGFFMIFLFSRTIYRNMLGMMEYYLGSVQQVVSSGENMVILLKPILPIMARIVGPILGVVFIAAFIGNVVQVGFQFSVKPLQPDVSRINPNPFRFFQRVLFSKQSAVNLGKTIFKIATIGVIAFFMIRKDLGTIMHTLDMGITQGVYVILSIAFKLVMIMSGVLLVLSIGLSVSAKAAHRISQDDQTGAEGGTQAPGGRPAPPG
jgi:flagellar biosynthetic protein FlhB